jgi:D-amino acid aminotransferase
MIVDLDGELVAAEEARVSPFDAAYQYGDGVFDTLRTYRGFAFGLEDHIERLARETELLQIPFDAALAPWRERIERLLSANGLAEIDARVRIQISRGGGARTDQVRAEPETIPPVVFTSALPVSDEVERWQRDGVHALPLQSSFARGNFPQIKTLNYLPSLMAQRFAFAQGFQEVVLLNRQSKVLEGATSNIFLITGKVLRTPSARLGLLPGITRGRVLVLGRTLGLEVQEVASDLRDLLLAEEVFLSGSVKELVPVVRIDRSSVGDGRPGRWTRRLQEAYRALVEDARSAPLR